MNIPQIELTAVYVTDVRKGFTVFFAQVPHIIAEGRTLEEATLNLFQTLKIAFKHERTEKFESGDRCMNTEVITKTFNMDISTTAI